MIKHFVPGMIDDRDQLPKAELRAVAFLDILGFRALSTALLSDPSQLDALDYQMRLAERVLVGDVGVVKDTAVRLFSDCILISCPVSPEHLVRLLFTLEFLQLRLVNSGVFIRGGLAIGTHFQTSRALVSSGLITAYELESKIAVFPRVAIHESFVNEISKLGAQPWVNPWRTKTYPFKFMAANDRVRHHSGLHIRVDATDGIPYVHYLADLYSVDHGPVIRDYLLDHKHSILRWIKQGRSAGYTPGIRAKHEWLVEYHNAGADEIWGAESPFRIDPCDLEA